MISVNYNGSFVDSRKPGLEFDNRGFRYGDGLFETMRFQNGNVQLDNLHMERLFDGIAKLKFNVPAEWTPTFFIQQIVETCSYNALDVARIRLTIYRGTGAINDYRPQYASFLIETYPLSPFAVQLPELGLRIEIYRDACKCYDSFANLKTNNYLVSVMASIFVNQSSFDECVILNHLGRVCEFTIGNIFWVKDEVIYTVPLSEAPVAGVIRKWIIDNTVIHGFTVIEQVATPGDLKNADEIFLTNSIAGIRWVQGFGSAEFTNTIASAVYRKMIATIAG